MNIEFCKECADYGKCNPNDCPYFEDEQEELNNKAKELPRQYERATKENKERKPKTVKISDEKKMLFNNILGCINTIYGENVEILTENKLISVKIGGKVFKIDIIEQRKPKK